MPLVGAGKVQKAMGFFVVLMVFLSQKPVAFSGFLVIIEYCELPGGMEESY